MIRLCAITDIQSGDMLPIDQEGMPPLAVFNLDDKIYVTSNICTHNVARLTDGFFEDGLIECPLHSGAFDVKTGEPEAFPCEIPLKTYEVTIKDGFVYIDQI